MKKLAIITTHPIQYNAPFFKLLTERGKVQLKVFYTWPQAMEGFDDPDFGKKIKWDIPLLDGYNWEAVENVSKKPSSKYWKGIDCPDLIERIKVCNPDAVMVYGWNLKSHFKAMRYFKGKIPVWFFGDSTLLDEQPGIKKILRRIWLTWVYRHIDKAFYVGTNSKAYFKAHGIKEDQLEFFPHAVDNERFFDNEERQYEKKAQQWRRELGYREDDVILLFAGKLEHRKSPEFLVKSIIKFNSVSHKKVNLLIFGEGPLLELVKNVAGNNQYVKFMTFQNQSAMPIVYRLGDIFYLSSKSETWGLAVNEALASERPVLISDKVGCAVDLANNTLFGFIFNSDDVKSLTDQLFKFLLNRKSIPKKDIIAKIRSWSFFHKCEAIEKSMNILVKDNE